jgi:hypothetical protein
MSVGNNVNSPIRTSAIGLLQHLQLKTTRIQTEQQRPTDCNVITPVLPTMRVDHYEKDGGSKHVSGAQNSEILMAVRNESYYIQSPVHAMH